MPTPHHYSTGPTQCTACKDGDDSALQKVQNGYTVTSPADLTTNAFLKPAVSTGYWLNKGVCVACPANCKQCSGGGTCNTCNLQVVGTEVRSSFLSQSAACLACPTGCATCTNPSLTATATCLTCQPGYYLTGATCTACFGGAAGSTGVAGVATCTDATVSGITKCKDGYFLNTGGCQYCGDTSNLVSPFGCGYSAAVADSSAIPKVFKNQAFGTCTNGTRCTSCTPTNVDATTTPGWLLTGSNSCIACTNKGTSGTAGSGVCAACATNADICDTCVTGAYLDSTNRCQNCITNCKKCSSAGTCDVCNDGYYLDPTTKNCFACTSAISGSKGCLSCTGPNQCSRCSDGQYVASNGVCLDCPTSLNAVACSDASTPLACAATYYLSGTNCVKCGTNCDVCVNNGAQCAKCTTGTVVSGNPGNCA